MNKQEHEALRLCVESLDQLMPYLAKVPADVGLLNDALVAARPLLGAEPVEPAPAQDDREAFENYMLDREHPVIGWIWTDWFKRGDDPETYANDYVQGAWVMWQARPAQTEQQEERWQVRYLPGQKVEERWWQDSTAERAAWCAEANAEQLAKGLPDVWEIRKFYTAPIAQAEQQPLIFINPTVVDELEGRRKPSSGGLTWSRKACAHWTFPLYAARPAQTAPQGKFAMGDRVKKTSGSEWVGHVCGTYSTALTPEGYAVESEAHAGSVQIYPDKALEAAPKE